ncbi:MAG: MOSC and FAD-binding oxidoreductase domain-containing protein [Deltaproteobacteria bacterium]|nr:MOSC and FAD-binding oxidoreductase domain-containing protein [Deltaproteobacteria bacterium]
MGRLLAVNVGLPRDVAWHGATVHTGVWKQAVAGPRLVRRLNVDGDGQGDLGGHGGEHRAVLVYQIESYRYWQRHFGRDDFSFGQFGENFTVDGLADDAVCIGDRYRIGSAEFEVTQPRVTCYRVGLRLNEPQMAALLVSHHRPGFYMRVLSEGRVEAGDEIVKLADGPERMSVAEIDALLYLPERSRAALDRALRIPALSPGWRTSLQALREQAGDERRGRTGNPGLTAAAASPPPAWSGFRALRVAGIAPESRHVASLRLAALDGAALPAALPGQYLAVRVRPGAEAVIRNYSLSGPPGASDYRISVKREPHGAVSSFLHTQVRVGDQLDVAAPRGGFILRDGDAPVLLLSAGIGVTPVLAMLHALAAARVARPVWWLHGARDGSEHSFAAESRRLLAALPHAQAQVFYSRPASGDQAGQDYTRAGRLSAALLRDLALPAAAEAYLCGPTGFVQELGTALRAQGFDAARIHSEVFGAAAPLTPGIAGTAQAPHQPNGPAGSGPAVAFARSGLRVNWSSQFGSLLELAEACGVATRWSCRTGVCHTCETGLLAGVVRHAPAPLDAPAEGNVLVCCAQPAEDIVLDL